MHSTEKVHSNIDEFLSDYHPQDIKTNIFEQLPTKVYRGYESLIAINSILVPVVNKTCPQDNCKNGLVYYEKGSETFTLKFHSDLSEYIPVITLQRVEKSTVGDNYTTFTFVLRNRSKYNARVIMKPDTQVSSLYKFKGDLQEIDQMLNTNEKEGGQTKTELSLEVRNDYYGNILIFTDINLIMTNAESLVVHFDLILQLGDEESQKYYINRYYK